MSSSEWQRENPDPFARVWSEIRKVRAETGQRVNYLLRNAGIRVAEGALHVLQRLVVEGDQEVTGSLAVSGDAAFTGDTTIGGTLGVTGVTTLGGATTISGDTGVTGDLGVTGNAEFSGDTTIGGNASITGTLSLPAGIIGNEALASPVTGDTGNASTGVAVPYGTGGTLAAAFSFTVPAGFSEARVMAVSGVALAADSTCIAQTHIGGVSGDDMPIITGGGAAAFSRTITGLTGGAAITVATRVRSFTGTSSAYVITSATVTYLR